VRLSVPADAQCRRTPLVVHGFVPRTGRNQCDERRATMATIPDLPTPITPDLPVEPDEGPSTPPDEPTDPEPPPTAS